MPDKEKYVDALKLAETMWKMAGSGNHLTSYDLGHHFGIIESIALVKSTPAADVAPVRRTTYKYFNGYTVPRCVNCRCALSLEWVYCPECGALIDYDAPESGDRVED